MSAELERILIARLSSIGDVVLTTPVIRAVRRRFPEARIDFVIKREFAELVRTNPHLTTVYEYDKRSGLRGLFALAAQLRANRYDLFADIHNNFRTRLLRLLTRPARVVTYSKQIGVRTLLVATGINRYGPIQQVPDRYIEPLRVFGVENDAQGLELFPTPKHRARVSALWREAGLHDADLAIGFGPIAAHALKQWPVERFVAVGRTLAQRYHARIVLFGGPNDCEQVAHLAAQLPNVPINLCGRVSLLEAAAAIERCAVFVGNDTGTVHIAAAVQRPVVVLFGPTVEEFGYYPYRTPAVVLSKPLPCRPCTHNGTGRCKIGTHACLTTIAPEEVVQAVERYLQLQNPSLTSADYTDFRR